MATYEIEIVTSNKTLDVGSPGNPIMANLEVYNGVIGPVIPNDFDTIPDTLDVGDSLFVRLINDLNVPTGIHWHGIELQNNADGTPVTQAEIPGGNLQTIPNRPLLASVGGTYLYKFKVTRPGIFWFHPHHHHSTNRVFRGTYGMIIVTDPDESTLIGNTLPDLSETHQLILSDITVCKTPGLPVTDPLGNDDQTYIDPTDTITMPLTDHAEWLSGATSQPGPTPRNLCEIAPLNDDGTTGGAIFPAGDVPYVQQNTGGRTNEGQTVLTNGKNVGLRLGKPLTPGSFNLTDLITINVQSDRGLRLQVVNCAFARYFRLRLTDNSSPNNQIELIRVGGEGGLLDESRIEGGVQGGLNTNYDPGEILIPPSSRADFVAVIPNTETIGNVLTLWTRDFRRLGGGGGWTNTPSVPVAHFIVTAAGVTPYTLTTGTALRAKAEFPGSLVSNLPDTSTTNFVTPTGGFVDPKLGMVSKDIELTANPGGPAGINGVEGHFSGIVPYTSTPHLMSTRYAKSSDELVLMVVNSTSANHPFHLHGFSFQPKSITPIGTAEGGTGSYTWDYQEFRDTLNIPGNHRLKLVVRIDPRNLNDDVTPGGELGRWLFHCHIFFHAHNGMIGELVVTDSDDSGDERPNVDVRGSWTYAPTGGIATRTGTYFLPDGDTIDTINTIVAHLDDGTPIGDITIVNGTQWEWQSHTPPDTALVDTDDYVYVYVTITGDSGRKDQTVFRLQIGGADQGSDNGDPHIRTIDGTNYDLQSVGEFTLLADRDGMEVQSRQTPVPTATPVTNSYTGLTSCVSVNTAVAARLGSHTISYQPGEGEGTLQFYVDGKPAKLTTRTLNLDNNLVRGIDIDGKMTLRIDYEHHAVLVVTPRFWGSNNIHYMNISLSHTHGDEGLMGKIPAGSWLPRLRSGATLGSKPESLNDRYIELYQTFADSWRVTDRNSLFTYAPGTSTETFTDKDWPTLKPPCKLKPQFELPGATPQQAIPEAEAKIICKAVTEDDLFENCVLDVAATGEKSFADGYLLEQRIRLSATSVQIVCAQAGDKIKVIAIVLPLHIKGEKLTGKVTFSVNGANVGQPVAVDSNGHAHISLDRPKEDDQIAATYDGGDEYGLSSSISPNLTLDHCVAKGQETNGDNKRRPWYIWLILALLVLLLFVFV